MQLVKLGDDAVLGKGAQMPFFVWNERIIRLTRRCFEFTFFPSFIYKFSINEVVYLCDFENKFQKQSENTIMGVLKTFFPQFFLR